MILMTIRKFKMLGKNRYKIILFNHCFSFDFKYNGYIGKVI